MRKCNEAGRKLIQSYEGLRLKAYRCPAGILTVGVGHTGPDVKEGMAITQAKADELFSADLAKFEKAVSELCPVATDNQFAALVSFAYNLGPDALKHSTLRRLHNEGDHDGAQAQFAKWVNAAGRKLPGLVKRRAAEAMLYGTP